MSGPIERRGFLKSGAAAVGAVLLAAGRHALAEAAGADEKQRQITLGFSLYGMKTLALGEALAGCAKIGYDAVELAAMPDWPAAPGKLPAAARRQLRERLAELGLSLPALMENLNLGADDAADRGQLERLKAVGELARDLAPDAPPLIETVVGGKAGEWAKIKERFADRLAGWVRVAEQTQTVLAIKPHRFGAMNAPADAVALVNQMGSPWLKLAYDYSHFQFRDLPLDDTLKQMIPLTRFIHVKDTVLDKGNARFVLPGEGGFDYVPLLRKAEALGYRGCVCVEVSGMVSNQPGYDPLAAAKRSYDNLAPAFEKAGINRSPIAAQ
ncbi:MAG TPA: sugar phosphate isomerase/epimerase [Pirellulales bacterium]|nr:sugar phosphate isomerase/epimerase [Pirellulales bacterium]